MRKNFLIVMASVALAIIGAVAAFYFLMKLRTQMDAETAEVEAMRDFVNQNKNQNEKTSEDTEGATLPSESRP